MRVYVYWNVHKQKFSIRHQDTRKVIAHAKDILLKDAVFKVSESGRDRVRLEGKKYVHAGIIGTLVALRGESTEQGRQTVFGPPTHSLDTFDKYSEAKDLFRRLNEQGRRIRYNPYRDDGFMMEGSKTPATKASYVSFSINKFPLVMSIV